MDTDRRLRSALLPYQPRLLHDVLDSLDDVAVLVLDETARVLAANATATRLLGVPRGRRAGDGGGPVVTVTAEGGVPVSVLDYVYWRGVARRLRSVDVRVGLPGGERVFAVTALPVGGEDEAVVCRYVDVTAKRELERRVAAAAASAARAEIDLVAAEQRVAMLEELLVYLATGQAGPAD